MESLLFLVHRIPYPPNKGDKIRSFNLLKYLSAEYRVYLGTFVDEPVDWKYLREVEAYCAQTRVLGLNSRLRKLRSMVGLATGRPLSIPYYHDRRMQKWVDYVIATQNIHRSLVFSSPMAQYLSGPPYAGVRRVMDFVDVDSEKWRQYAGQHGWPMNRLYRREADTLLSFEREVAGEFDASVFVTAREAELFRRLAPDTASRVTHLENGVDADYFAPMTDCENPYPDGGPVLVFTGAMDYWANVDAVTWFAREVFPVIRAAVSNARLYIVGARPTDGVIGLRELPGVTITGAVGDMRPYLQHAAAALAPLRVARGMQNKVLEAMAMARPVLATPAAMEGIRNEHRFAHLVAEDARVLAERAVELMRHGDTEGLGQAGRENVLACYEWSAQLARLDGLLAPPSPVQDNSAGMASVADEPVRRVS